MCGIVVGMSFGKKFDAEKELVRQSILKILTTELLLLTEERGKDAVGASILFDDGRFFGIKRGESSDSFLKKFATTKEYYGGLLHLWDQYQEPCRIYLGHCRKGTGGDKEDNANNHPIKLKNLVGIHNGVIRNDDEIFEKLSCKRDGQVDSEAIFRLFDYCTKHGSEPFTLEMLVEIANRLDGEYAISLFNADNREQIPFIRYRRPVEFILLREWGIMFAISELKFWRTAHFRYERIAHYYKDVLKISLPSFLHTEKVDKQIMEDDSVAIFDLTQEIGKDTKVADVIAKKRITGAKLWKATTYTGYGRSGGHAYGAGPYWNRHSGTGAAASNATGAASSAAAGNTKGGDQSKARVFDKLTRKYVVKTGDKVIDSDKAIALPAGGAASTTTIVDNISNKPEEEFNYSTDTEQEKSRAGSQKPLEVDDKTKYVMDPDAKQKDTTDVHYDGGEETPETLDADFRVISVENLEDEDDTAEFMDAARQAYRKLPEEKHGYSDMEGIINDLSIEESVIRKLGPKFLANRVAQHSWVKGYASACKDHKNNQSMDIQVVDKSNDETEKTRKREKYIVGLKRLVMIMVYAMTGEKDQPKGHELFANHINDKLKQLALDNPTNIDVDTISNLFTNYEQAQLEEVLEVVKQAEEYKKSRTSEN